MLLPLTSFKSLDKEFSFFSDHTDGTSCLFILKQQKHNHHTHKFPFFISIVTTFFFYIIQHHSSSPALSLPILMSCVSWTWFFLKHLAQHPSRCSWSRSCLCSGAIGRVVASARLLLIDPHFSWLR
jgi:hypothetical protein